MTKHHVATLRCRVTMLFTAAMCFARDPEAGRAFSSNNPDSGGDPGYLPNKDFSGRFVAANQRPVSLQSRNIRSRRAVGMW